jgi:hypothetical protein
MARHATYDQDKVTQLRMQVIEDSLAVFNNEKKVEKWSQYRKDLLMKYAPRVLPVLQELSGRDGGELNIQISESIANKNGINPMAKPSSK